MRATEPNPAVPLCAALGLLAALLTMPSAQAQMEDPAARFAREGRVVVRIETTGEVLAEGAALTSIPPFGPAVRMRDFETALPQELGQPVPVRHGGEWWWPLARLEPFARLDRKAGIVRIRTDVEPGPISLPFAAGGHAGGTGGHPGGSGVTASGEDNQEADRAPSGDADVLMAMLRDLKLRAYDKLEVRGGGSSEVLVELPPPPRLAEGPVLGGDTPDPAHGQPAGPGVIGVQGLAPLPDRPAVDTETSFLDRILTFFKGEPASTTATGPELILPMPDDPAPPADRSEEARFGAPPGPRRTDARTGGRIVEAMAPGADEYIETLLEVRLNGETVSPGLLVLETASPGGEQRFALRVVDLRLWRVRIDPKRIVTFGDEPFYPLEALPGAQIAYDPATLVLRLEIPAMAFELTRLAEDGARDLPAPAAGTGGFFDYDLLLLAGEGTRPRLDGLFEAGVFSTAGVLATSVRSGDVFGGGKELVRLETTAVRDFPDRRASLRLGDGLSEGGALARPVRFAGIQYRTDFSTDPAFVTFPLPRIGGLADQRSTAEVILENGQRLVEEVPPGPFEINSLPVVSGAGDLQLRVTDLLGREQIVTQSFYVSPRLLKAGLEEFSYELGVARESFNEKSFGYGQPLGAVTRRYGFSDGVTGEGRLEVGLERRALGGGAAFLIGDLGLISTGVLGSHDEDEGLGYEAFADYEYRAAHFNVGVGTRATSRGFRQIGLDDAAERRTDQLAFGVSLGDFGRLGLLAVNGKGRDSEDQRLVSGNYSLPLARGSLLVNALQTIEPERGMALMASYSVTLGSSRTLSAGSAWRDGALRTGAQFRQGRGSSELGPSYRIASEISEEAQRLDGSFRYDSRLTSTQLDLVQTEDETQGRLSLQGSVASLDGHLHASRQLGEAFAQVAVPGHADIAVLLENREVGRTDADGNLFLPRLNPYQANRIRIRAEDLPLTTELVRDEVVAVPAARSGLTATFEVRDNRTALAVLLDSEGDPLPAGLVLLSRDGRAKAQIAEAGLAFITGEGDGARVIASPPEFPPFRCDLPPLPEAPMTDLGTLRCQ